MLTRVKRGWELPESAATPESVYLTRRTLAKALAAGPLIAAGASLPAWAETSADPTADLYPATRNDRYTVMRPLTDEETATSYNNFYEFGSHKRIAKAAREMVTRPWTVTIDGMVEKEQVLDIDTLIRMMPLEERVYRHRCVEAWAMTVPWSGFPMSTLVALAAPSSGVRYVRMETFAEVDWAPGLRQFWYPWPYTEGLTIEEATNDLAFLVTGLYGKPVPNQNGAPLRLALPWKYGFKSIKSITRFTFTDRRPLSYWEQLQDREYGFWANVNPEVPHPRWSQATEELIGTGGERVPTRLFNGYGEFVAHLYDGLDGERLWM